MIIHYICKYTPIELIEGFGTDVQKLEPEYANFNCAENCTHQNMCGYGKAILENIIQKDIKNLILVNCCDVCRRIYDVLKTSNNMDFIFLIDVPHKNDTASIKYLDIELKRLSSELSKISNFDKDKFNKSCELHKNYNSQSYDLTKENVAIIGAHTGKFLQDKIKQNFDIPVYDYTCGGYRELDFNSDNFYEQYSSALINQKNSCSRMQFENKIVIKRAKGIICNSIKFCDYYGFTHRKTIQSSNTPVISIETDCTTQAKEQIMTRIEAFKESLSAKNNIELKKNNKYSVGIDIGSTCTKGVIIDSNKTIIASAISETGIGAKNAADKILNMLVEKSELKKEELTNIITTGYGRNTSGISSSSVTEITCHAKGANFLYPDAHTIIDIGGQDLKVICINSDGSVKNFVMNDKCAAGTGRFLDAMARVLGLDIEKMSKIGMNWKNDIIISSMCTVFAESEVVSLIANNVPIEDIIHGLNMSVASKILTLTKKLNCEPKFVMTGGVAINIGVVNAIKSVLNEDVYVPNNAQLCGAIGAALFGL